MSSSATLLRIIEENMERLLDKIAADFRNSKRTSFQTFRQEALRTLAWSHIDPIIQSLRYDDDYLFVFFLDYASNRNAEAGLPIEDSLFTINSLSAALWELVQETCAPEDVYPTLSRLEAILNKGRNGIAENYMDQRDSLLQELRRSNNKLMEMTKHKMEFLAKVSHELKTPLTSVLAYSEQLQEPSLPEDIRQEFIGVVHSQSTKLLHLIEDLLDLSKHENEHTQLNIVQSDLNTVLEEAISTVEARASEKNISLELEPCVDIPRIMMDPFRIQQVVWNLLTNAVKYNRPDGRVTLAAKQRGDEVVVSVTDNGIGIKEEEVNRIFSSFHQTCDAIASNEGGAGLGLDIVRHFLNLHNGDVWVESQWGKGSTFYFSLPINGPSTGEVEEREITVEQVRQATDELAEGPQVREEVTTET